MSLPPGWKSVSISQALNEYQQNELLRIFYDHNLDFNTKVNMIENCVIIPWIDDINARLGQENHPRFLSYALMYALVQATSGEEPPANDNFI